MGGRYSQLHYRRTDTAIHNTLSPLSDGWTIDDVRKCSLRLRQISCSMLLTNREFAKLLQLDPKNPAHAAMARHWFSLLLNVGDQQCSTRTARRMIGLDFLAGLSLCLRKSGDGIHGVAERAGVCFDMFDFRGTGSMHTNDILMLLHCCVRGLCAVTRGLRPLLTHLCSPQHMRHLVASVGEPGLVGRDIFIQWVTLTPATRNLLLQLHPRPATEIAPSPEQAAILIQAISRSRSVRVDIKRKRQQLVEASIARRRAVRVLKRVFAQWRYKRRRAMVVRAREWGFDGGVVFASGRVAAYLRSNEASGTGIHNPASCTQQDSKNKGNYDDQYDPDAISPEPVLVQELLGRSCLHVSCSGLIAASITERGDVLVSGWRPPIPVGSSSSASARSDAAAAAVSTSAAAVSNYWKMLPGVGSGSFSPRRFSPRRSLASIRSIIRNSISGGEGRNSIMQLLQPEHRCGFRSVSCGQQHCAIVTEDHRLLMWGSCTYGQLGVTGMQMGMQSMREKRQAKLEERRRERAQARSKEKAQTRLRQKEERIRAKTQAKQKARADARAAKRSQQFKERMEGGGGEQDHERWRQQEERSLKRDQRRKQMQQERQKEREKELRKEKEREKFQRKAEQAKMRSKAKSKERAQLRAREMAQRCQNLHKATQAVTGKHSWFVPAETPHMVQRFNHLVRHINQNSENQDENNKDTSREKHKRALSINMPVGLPGLGSSKRQVRQVVCGDHFTLVVTRAGQLYSWGEGSEGQLGHGVSDSFSVGMLDKHVPSSTFSSIATPKQVAALRHVQVAKVAAGGNHVYAITVTGVVYTWGFWGRSTGSRNVRTTKAATPRAARGPELEDDEEQEKSWVMKEVEYEMDSTFAPVVDKELTRLRPIDISCGAEHRFAITPSLTLRMPTADPHVRIHSLPAMHGPCSVDLDGLTGELLYVPLEEHEIVELSQRADTYCKRKRRRKRHGGHNVLDESDSGSGMSDSSDSDSDTDISDRDKRRAEFAEAFEKEIFYKFKPSKGKIVLLDQGQQPGTRVSFPDGSEVAACSAHFGRQLGQFGVAAPIWFEPNCNIGETPGWQHMHKNNPASRQKLQQRQHATTSKGNADNLISGAHTVMGSVGVICFRKEDSEKIGHKGTRKRKGRKALQEQRKKDREKQRAHRLEIKRKEQELKQELRQQRKQRRLLQRQQRLEQKERKREVVMAQQQILADYSNSGAGDGSEDSSYIQSDYDSYDSSSENEEDEDDEEEIEEEHDEDDDEEEDAVTRLIRRMVEGVMRLQEAGAEAVMLVLDIDSVAPFELETTVLAACGLPADTVTIPVLMVGHQQRKYLALAAEHSMQVFAFSREDLLPACIRCAGRAGAAGVVVAGSCLEDVNAPTTGTGVAGANDARDQYAYNYGYDGVRICRTLPYLRHQIDSSASSGARLRRGKHTKTSRAEVVDAEKEMPVVSVSFRSGEILRHHCFALGDKLKPLKIRFECNRTACLEATAEALCTDEVNANMQGQHTPADQAQLRRKKARAYANAGGDLYAWGCAEGGRLGLGDPDTETAFFQSAYDPTRQESYRYTPSPLLVATLAGVRLLKMSCGREHSVAISQAGEEFAWGTGDWGQLGLGEESLDEEVHTPRLVQSLASHAVTDVACGSLCTFRVARRLPLRMQVERTARAWEIESEFREVLLWSDEEDERKRPSGDLNELV